MFWALFFLSFVSASRKQLYVVEKTKYEPIAIVIQTTLILGTIDMSILRNFCVATLALILVACASIPYVTAVDPYPFAPQSAITELRPDGPSPSEINTPTQVVVLGTGTPVPDAYRAGSSIAVIHKGYAYLFDVGAGSVRRAIEARYKYDILALYPHLIRAVFITHMHSDHVMDLSELTMTYWWRRNPQLLAFGPEGMRDYFDGMEKMVRADLDFRLNGVQPVDNRQGFLAQVTEISPGIIFEENGLTVEAFAVPHGTIKPAFGYKIVTDDLSLVISGDTAKSEVIPEKSKGVDLLFHEVISDVGFARLPPFWQRYHTSAHTLASDVGRMAQLAKPKKLVLYHGLYYGVSEETVLEDARKYFDGEVLLAADLDKFSAADFTQ